MISKEYHAVPLRRGVEIKELGADLDHQSSRDTANPLLLVTIWNERCENAGTLSSTNENARPVSTREANRVSGMLFIPLFVSCFPLIALMKAIIQ